MNKNEKNEDKMKKTIMKMIYNENENEKIIIFDGLRL